MCCWVSFFCWLFDLFFGEFVVIVFFNVLLIVNCGEIVICIVCVCVDLGICLVVVFVEDDVVFLYVCKVDVVLLLVGCGVVVYFDMDWLVVLVLE